MSKLQDLLDQKWPISVDISPNDLETLSMFRRIFTEGWNSVMTICENDGDTMEDEAYKYAKDLINNEHTIAVHAYLAGAHDFSAATIIRFKKKLD